MSRLFLILFIILTLLTIGVVIYVLFKVMTPQKKDKKMSNTESPKNEIISEKTKEFTQTIIPDKDRLIKDSRLVFFLPGNENWFIHMVADTFVPVINDEKNAIRISIAETSFPYPDTFDIMVKSSNGDLILGYLDFVEIVLYDTKIELAQIVPKEKLKHSWKLVYLSNNEISLFQQDKDSLKVLGMDLSSKTIKGFNAFKNINVMTSIRLV